MTPRVWVPTDGRGTMARVRAPAADRAWGSSQIATIAAASEPASPGSYVRTVAAGKVRSTSGRRAATTGLPMAAYSKTLVDRLTSVNRSRRVGGRPRAARATAARTAAIGNGPRD